MASDSARLQVVIESRNTSGPTLDAFRRQIEGMGITVNQLTLGMNKAGDATARFSGTASGAGFASATQAAQRFHQELGGIEGAANRVTASLVGQQQAAQQTAAQIALLRERLAGGGAAQVQIAGLSPQQLQGIQQAFRLANVEVEQLGANVTRTGQTMRTLQLTPGRGGATQGVLGPLLTQLGQGELASVRFTEGMSRGLRGATEEMSKLAQGIGHGLGLFSSFGAGIGTAVVTAAVVKAIADTSKQFAIFDEQVRGTNALLGLTGDASEQSFHRMESSIRSFAVATGTDAVNDTKALYQVLSAGIPQGEQAFQVLRAGANLAIGGLTDTKTAIDGVTSVLNAYRLSAGDAAKVSDQFYAASKAGKITVEQLAQGIGTAVPVASALGVNFGELAGVIASATSQGVQAGAAFEGTRAALNAMLRPTAEAQQVAAQLGIQFDASAVHSKGFVQALNDIVAVVGTGPGGQRILATLFGDIQAVNTVLAITGPNAEATARAIRTVSTASGDASRAADEVNKSLGRSFATLGANVREVALRLGELSAGPLKNAIDDVNRLGVALGAWPDTAPSHDQIDRLRAFQQVQQNLTKTEKEQDDQARNSASVRERNDRLATATRVVTSIGAGVGLGTLIGGPVGAGVGAAAGLAAFRAQQERGVFGAPAAPQRSAMEQAVTDFATASQREFARLQSGLQTQAAYEEHIKALADAYATLTDSVKGYGTALDANERRAQQVQRNEILGRGEELDRLQKQLTQGFQKPESEIGVQVAGLNLQIAQTRLNYEAQLDPLEKQLRTLQAQRDVTDELAVANLGLERIQLEQSHTRERQLDLEDQNLSALEQRNQARQQGLILGIKAPIIQRVAEAAGANVNPDSPEFQTLTLAQKYIALLNSNTQAAFRRSQIAVDPGRAALDAQTRELDFRTKTKQLALDEFDARKRIAELPLQQQIDAITLAMTNELTPLQRQTEELQKQTAELQKQKAEIEWRIQHLAPTPPGPPPLEATKPPEAPPAQPATTAPTNVAAPTESSPAPPPAEAPPPVVQAPQVPAENVPISQAPPNTLVPGGEGGAGTPLGEAPPGVPLATQLATGGPPVIRGTGVPPAQRLVQPTVTVHVNNPVVDSDERSRAHAQATAQAVLAALNGGFDTAPSSDSAGARYTP